MGYHKAEDILPMEIIELIQQYVDGKNIYIPRKENKRLDWGTRTTIRMELKKRNEQIFCDYQNELSVKELAEKYYLSEKSIQRIIREMKKVT